MSEMTFSVPDMTCGHCEHAVSTQISAVPGVRSVVVNLDTKRVDVRGEDLDAAAIRAAIADAGYAAS